MERFPHPQPLFTKDGVKTLLWVKKRILAEPRSFDMLDWVRHSKDRGIANRVRFDEALTKFLTEPQCGTAACLYGWVALKPRTKGNKVQRIYDANRIVVISRRMLFGYNFHRSFPMNLKAKMIVRI
jgi:hypothetical protein